MECTGQNQIYQEEIHHPTNMFQCIFLDLLLIEWIGYTSAMGVMKPPSSCSSTKKILRNQFIYYHMSCRGYFGINHFKPRNFAFVAIVVRDSIMTRMHKWSMMIYGSPQAEFTETKHNSHIHGYGTPILGKIVVYISKLDYMQALVLEYNFHCREQSFKDGYISAKEFLSW